LVPTITLLNIDKLIYFKLPVIRKTNIINGHIIIRTLVLLNKYKFNI